MLFLFKSICATIDNLAEKDPMDGAESEAMLMKSSVKEELRSLVDLLLEDCSHSAKQQQENDYASDLDSKKPGKKFQASCADLFVQHHMVHGTCSYIHPHSHICPPLSSHLSILSLLNRALHASHQGCTCRCVALGFAFSLSYPTSRLSFLATSNHTQTVG